MFLKSVAGKQNSKGKPLGGEGSLISRSSVVGVLVGLKGTPNKIREATLDGRQARPGKPKRKARESQAGIAGIRRDFAGSKGSSGKTNTWLSCGAKLDDRRGKPQVLVHVSTYQGNPFWNSGFLSHSHLSLEPPKLP